jgi:hypothetical protein
MDMEQAETETLSSDYIEDVPLTTPPETQTTMTSLPSEWQIPLVVLVSLVEE